MQHISFEPHRTVINAIGKPKIYIPTATGLKFHQDESFVKLVMGPYGSGKSTMCVNHIVRMACAMPYWHNGRRKSRWAIVRNTSGELQSTTLQTWLQWFGDLGDMKKRQKPLLTYEHMFNDGHGIVELELIFIALDREEDLRKIKSLEVTGAYINELSEVPQGTLSHFKGRVNHRYPSRSFCDAPYWSGIIADTNPPDVDHWIYKDFEVKNIDSYQIFKQPPGLLKDENGRYIPNPDCDNFANLASDYYVQLAGGNSEDFIKVYCLGQYGSVGFGKLVYPEFKDGYIRDNIPAIQGEPLYLGWDFGLTPACVVLQISPRGQVRCLKEYTSEDMGIRTFAKNIVIPAIARDFPYCKIATPTYADPSGVAGNDILEELSCIGELNSLGIVTQPASTNDIEPRIGSVRYFLNANIDGEAAFIISRVGCPVLIRGFIKDYCYKRISVSGEERYRDIPHKNHASHPHDALQYAMLQFAADRILQEKHPQPKVDISNPVMRIWQ